MNLGKIYKTDHGSARRVIGSEGILGEVHRVSFVVEKEKKTVFRLFMGGSFVSEEASWDEALDVARGIVLKAHLQGKLGSSEGAALVHASAGAPSQELF